jgi:hypothetical protein
MASDAPLFAGKRFSPFKFVAYLDQFVRCLALLARIAALS